ncbi:DUF1554 domain-containing protein [Leptospira semungkisensis]|uniref:DUF1554 domain-containing protein n=1 Tax=Leptospira semungkisensis TaxID=2484985 RepID=UPI001FE7D42F|nr:DUF1554 domain-containing protein [Leptospira semungkisensis]
MFRSFLALILFVSLAACAIKTTNPGDPSSADFFKNEIISCLIESCNQEILISGGSIVPEESSLTLSISLPKAPSSSASYSFSVSNPSLGSVSPSTLIFTAANFNIPQTITILGAADDTDTVDNFFVLDILDPEDQSIHYSLKQKDNDRFLFATNPTYAGNFSITFADAICAGEVSGHIGLPSGTYKALAVSGTWRRASAPQISWVLKPNMQYWDIGSSLKAYDTDASSYFIDSSGNGISSAGSNFWTGLNGDWTTGSDCLGWSSGAPTDQGSAGNPSNPTLSGISSGLVYCNNVQSLICVQQ